MKSRATQVYIVEDIKKTEPENSEQSSEPVMTVCF